ncbi:MAG: pyrroline-5-carboxylate reductase [Emcibacter sp.]|nr:pyrroline-5-carboxylate reductase [Emcibacter sp.]
MAILSYFTREKPLVLIGCGKMGGAMLQGWLNGGLNADAVYVVEPFIDSLKNMTPLLNQNNIVEKISDLPKPLNPQLVVLAVKPQVMEQAIADIRMVDCNHTVYLSIAAGKTIGFFESHLGKKEAIVRAMPNIPATIGKGITVACSNMNVSDAQKSMCNDLLAAVGVVEWIENENLMDAVTAISGSGPAYVFHLVEVLAGAGERIGLDKELAKKLARYTVLGSGALLEHSHEDASKLRINVTSPNGTTEAALNILMRDDGLGKLMMEAVRAANKRSRELAD